jgi:CDP-6-deoxy-D-xylo-4-hexulose-3-dehydrase
MPYRLAEDTIDQRDLGELITWLQGNPWLTMGPLTREFEAAWARWLGRRHAVFVNSGSSANLLMYYAALCSGRLRNRKVIVPSIAWATTLAPAMQFGFEPILCEAEPTTFGVDPVKLEALCREHDPALVIVVHVLGVPIDVEAVTKLSARYHFMLLEDSCAATGSRYDGRHVGTFGDFSTFSFYFGHHLSTIEGGMVCTDDEELHHLLLQIRSHGWANDLPADAQTAAAARHGVLEFNRRFAFYHPGFNVRPTDLNARLGLSQLARADAVVARRVHNDALYRARFREAQGFVCQRNDRATICSISFAALAASREHRERVAVALRAADVETRPLGGGSMGRQPFWTARYGVAAMPVADRVHECSFMLPNHPRLSDADVNAICDVVLDVKPGG